MILEWYNWVLIAITVIMLIVNGILVKKLKECAHRISELHYQEQIVTEQLEALRQRQRDAEHRI